MRMEKIFAVLAALWSSSLFGDDLATINGISLTEKDFRDAVRYLGPSAAVVAKNPEMRERFLDHLIDNELLSKKGAEAKLMETAEFKAREAHAHREILANMFIEQYIKSRSTDADLEKYFHANKKKFITDEIKASHILLRSEKDAEKALKEALVPNADFQGLAKKYSTGPTKDRGGDLGWFGRGRMMPEFEKAAFSIKKGEVYPKVVRTQFGYHIIKVDDVRNESNTTFQDVRDQVEQVVTKNLRSNLIEDLRKSATIEIKSEALKKLEF